jgi:outer membrane murein-binding lipoprotein Lpp
MKIAIVLGGLLLVGCSSAPKVSAEKPQYCYTSQTIIAENGEKVNSRTQVECTDDQVKRLVKPRMGMADHCGTYTYNMTLGGRNVQRQGISCMVLNERGEVVGWEIVNH